VDVEEGRQEAALGHFRTAVQLASSDAVKARVTEALAGALFNQRRYAEAAKVYQSLATLAMTEPQRLEARRQWGWCEYHLGRVDTAVQVWQGMNVDEGWWLTGQAYLSAARPLDAAKAFRTLTEKFPNSPWGSKALAREGDALYNAGSFEMAVRSYQAALARDLPEDARREALYGLALAYERLGRRGEEIETKRKFVTAYPSEAASRMFYWQIGDRFREEGDWTRALAQYQAAMKAAPLASGWLKIAQVQATLRQFDASVESYQRFLQVAKGADRVPGLVGLAGLWLVTGQTEAAEAPLKELWESGPDAVKGWAATRLAEGYQGRGRTADAVAVWEWMAEQGADATIKREGRWRLAQWEVEQGRHPEALVRLDEIIRTDPARAGKALMMKGRSFGRVAQWTLAAAAYLDAANQTSLSEEERVTALARAAESFEAKTTYERI